MKVYMIAKRTLSAQPFHSILFSCVRADCVMSGVGGRLGCVSVRESGKDALPLRKPPGPTWSQTVVSQALCVTTRYIWQSCMNAGISPLLSSCLLSSRRAQHLPCQHAILDDAMSRSRQQRARLCQPCHPACPQQRFHPHHCEDAMHKACGRHKLPLTARAMVSVTCPDCKGGAIY